MSIPYRYRGLIGEFFDNCIVFIRCVVFKEPLIVLTLHHPWYGKFTKLSNLKKETLGSMYCYVYPNKPQYKINLEINGTIIINNGVSILLEKYTWEYVDRRLEFERLMLN